MATEAELIAMAVADGYPDVDESCGECSLVLKNYQHFIRCDRSDCPMKDGKGSILARLLKHEDELISRHQAQPED